MTLGPAQRAAKSASAAVAGAGAGAGEGAGEGAGAGAAAVEGEGAVDELPPPHDDIKADIRIALRLNPERYLDIIGGATAGNLPIRGSTSP